MPRAREPVELIKAKGKSHHLTKKIEAERKARQVKSYFSGLVEPEGLTAREKRKFWQWAEILDQLGILSDLDVEALARYVKAQERYLKAEKVFSKTLADKDASLDDIEQAQRIQDKALKSVTACAKCLGMTIDSRAKLIAPKIGEDDKPKNKFSDLVGGFDA